MEDKLESYRGISLKAVEFYGVTTTYNESGEAIRRVYPYPHRPKLRYLPKDFSKNTGFTTDHLFGQDKFNEGSSPFLTIVEGEDDCLAAYEILGHKYPVVSLPSATMSSKLKQNVHKYIDSFDKILVATDSDGPGDKAAATIAELFPTKTYRVSLTLHKDAQEYLEAGHETDFLFAWKNAKKYVPEFDTSTPDDYIALLNESEEDSYLPIGIEAYDKEHKGIFKGHMTLITAPEGSGKCLHPDQGVLMYDGSTKMAKDIMAGDKLIGPDSLVRNVLSITTGQEEMFRIIPTKGEPWICNKSHILSLVHSVSGEIVHITVEDYLNKGSDFKKHHLQYRSDVKAFSPQGRTSFNAYLVGAYLGDGHTHRCAISLGPKKDEVREHLKSILKTEGQEVYEVPSTGCTEVRIHTNWNRDNSFWGFIKPYVEKDSRRVPSEYKTASWSQRCALLAGLLDTDGSTKDNKGAEITQKSEALANDVCFVARSLGLAAYKKEKVVNSTSYWRVSISGDLTELPCLRLKFKPKGQRKSVLRTGISVESIGVGSYAGFCLDGDRRFLLDDFTVTHNTEWLHYLEHHLLSNYPDVPFACCHLEESKLRTTLAWASYNLGKNVTRKDLIDDVSEVEESIKKLTSRENAHLFKIGTDEDPTVLIDRVKYYARVFDCQYFFIEPIQDLAQQYDGAESTERFLSKIAVQLARIADDLNIGIIIIGHENDEGQVSDCRKLAKQASVRIRLIRDLENPDPVIRNTTTIRSTKNRPTAFVGYAGQVRFDPDTFTISEVFE